LLCPSVPRILISFPSQFRPRIKILRVLHGGGSVELRISIQRRGEIPMKSQAPTIREDSLTLYPAQRSMAGTTGVLNQLMSMRFRCLTAFWRRLGRSRPPVGALARLHGALCHSEGDQLRRRHSALLAEWAAESRDRDVDALEAAVRFVEATRIWWVRHQTIVTWRCQARFIESDTADLEIGRAHV
jgi:hypothetical protein